MRGVTLTGGVEEVEEEEDRSEPRKNVITFSFGDLFDFGGGLGPIGDISCFLFVLLTLIS